MLVDVSKRVAKTSTFTKPDDLVTTTGSYIVIHTTVGWSTEVGAPKN